MKTCTKCKNEKELTEFRVRGNGYNSWCKECQNLDSKKRYQPKPKRNKKLKDYDKIKYDAKIRMLKHRYQITIEEYNNMYSSQDEKCAICKEYYELGGYNGLHVDHNHSTGEVRGLLCRNCNSAIGQLSESEEILLEAIKYLGF